MRLNFVSGSIAVVTAFFAPVALGAPGYGDTAGAGYPSWLDRSVILLTDACRMDPVGYRDSFVGNYSILLPANYPATYPLYWNYDLNLSARAHAVDMADNCGLQHNSCNGTAWDARIKSYYTASAWIGENIASGYPDALSTLGQWLMDGTPPATDKSGSDGHRANIMSGNYKEMGTGYAYGAEPYNYFWVQDFGGGTSTFTNKIFAGSHLYRTAGVTTFMADYYDAGGAAPKKASVFVGAQEYALTRELGTDGKGTYGRSLAKASGCREYYFSFTDASGTVFRYPEQGYLVTTGEGACTTEYDPPHGAAAQGNRPASRPAGDGAVGTPAVFSLQGAPVRPRAGSAWNRSLPAGAYVVRYPAIDGAAAFGRLLVAPAR